MQAACPDTLSYDQLKRFKVGLPVAVNGTEFNPVTTSLTDSNLALEITAKLQTTSQASDSISCTYDLNATPQISGALVIKGKLANTSVSPGRHQRYYTYEEAKKQTGSSLK